MLRGLRPTTLLLNKQPYSKWNDLDRLLIQAYQQLEDESGNEHGLPLWLARSRDPEVMFVVETNEDRAAAALADWDKKHEKTKKEGLVRFVVPYSTDGTPLEYGGLTRQRYREAAIQEAQDREEGVELDRERPEGGYDPTEYGDGLTKPA